MDHAREVFEEEASHGFDPRLCGIRGTFRFDVSNVGSWYVAIDDGRVAIREDPGATADCVIEGPESDLVAILKGDLRAVIAFMQGRIRFRGHMALFNRFHGWAGTCLQTLRRQ